MEVAISICILRQRKYKRMFRDICGNNGWAKAGFTLTAKNGPFLHPSKQDRNIPICPSVFDVRVNQAKKICTLDLCLSIILMPLSEISRTVLREGGGDDDWSIFLTACRGHMIWSIFLCYQSFPNRLLRDWEQQVRQMLHCVLCQERNTTIRVAPVALAPRS
jgi:hypothetical protein